jgi:hypothetical protein
MGLSFRSEAAIPANKPSLEARLLNLSSRAKPRDLRCAFLPDNSSCRASAPLSVANKPFLDISRGRIKTAGFRRFSKSLLLIQAHL